MYPGKAVLSALIAKLVIFDGTVVLAKDIRLPLRFKRAAMLETVPYDICAQPKIKPTFESAQSDQSLLCPQEETFHTWLSKTRPGEISAILI